MLPEGVQQFKVVETLKLHKSPTPTLTGHPASPVPRRAVWSAALSTNGRGLQMLRTGRVSGLLPRNLHSSTPTGGARHSQGDHHFFQLMFRPRSPPPLSPTCDLPSTWAALQGQTLAGLLSFPWKRLQSTQSWHEELGKSEARSLGLPGFKILTVWLWTNFTTSLICFFSAYI